MFSHPLLYCSIKPTLKKVSKYENKFAKLQKKAAEFNFRNQLKTVKKKEFTLDEEETGVRFYFPTIIFFKINPKNSFPPDKSASKKVLNFMSSFY